MEIGEIKRIAELLQKVNCERIALISEVAKEMGVKKTALMQFIEDNPKLFRLGEKVKRTKNTQTTLGLGIMTAYLSADDNPDTEEWMEKMRKAWDKKIHIGEQTYYGVHEFTSIGLSRRTMLAAKKANIVILRRKSSSWRRRGLSRR